jgi:hypothetical protein
MCGLKLTKKLSMTAFSFGFPGREDIVLSFFSEQKRDLALDRYNAIVEQEIMEAGAAFLQNEAFAEPNLPHQHVNNNPPPLPIGGRWTFQEKV